MFASTKAAALEALSTWPGLRTVLAVETIRSLNGTDKVESEIRYFLSSCRDDPAILGRRSVLTGQSRMPCTGCWTSPSGKTTAGCAIAAAARNLALLRKIALNLVGRDRSSTASVRARRKRAAWNDDYMFQLLAGSSRSLA